MNCTYTGAHCTQTDAIATYENGNGETVSLCEGCLTHFGASAYCTPIDANGRTYTPGDEIASVSRSSRSSNPLMRGMVMEIKGGRPVVSVYGEGDELTDIRPDLFVITAPRRSRRLRPCGHLRMSSSATCTECTATDVTLTPEQADAYNRYISDGIGDTDGHYVPLTRAAWLATSR